MFNLSQEQAHTSSLGQNARVGVLALTYNVSSEIDLHNQRDNYLNDLDWDRPPPDKLYPEEVSQWSYSQLHSYLSTSFIGLTGIGLHQFIISLCHMKLQTNCILSVHIPIIQKHQAFISQIDCTQSDTQSYPIGELPHNLIPFCFHSLSTECFNQLPTTPISY